MLREVELVEPSGSGRAACDADVVDVEVEHDDARLLPAAMETPLSVGGTSSFWPNLRASLRAEPLLLQTLIGVVVGVMIGTIARASDPSHTIVELISFPGELFMRVLRALVLPLVSASMVCGVLALFDKTNNDHNNAKRVVTRLLLAYAVTTFVACAIGLLVVHVVRPGDGVSLEGKSCNASADVDSAPGSSSTQPSSALDSVLQTARSAVPSNIFAAASEGNVLGIIGASLFFGAALASVEGVEGNKKRDVINFFHQLNKIVEKLVRWAVQLMPVGVSSIVASRIAGTCDPLGVLQALGKYVFTVVLGLGMHAGLALPGMYTVATSRRFRSVFFCGGIGVGTSASGGSTSLPQTRNNNLSAFEVVKGGTPAFATAFAVDSSSVALPKTIQCAVSLGIPERLAKFSLPLGATVNMNGTALYEALTVLFIAQYHGVDLNFGKTVVVTVTSTIAAVGAAAIPSAGLVTMLLVLQAAGLSEFSDDIGALLALDWFLDRLRTVVNVQGDLMVVAALAQWEAEEGGGHERIEET